DPEMPSIQQIVHAVFLRRDGVIHRSAHDLEIRDVQLEASGCTAVGADRAMNHERRLLRHVIGGLELVVADSGLRYDGLDESGAVADREKVDFPAGAAVVEPPAD